MTFSVDIVLVPKPTTWTSTGPKLDWRIEDNSITLVDVTLCHHTHRIRRRSKADFCFDRLIIHQQVHNAGTIHQTNRTVRDKDYILHFPYSNVDSCSHPRLHLLICISQFHCDCEAHNPIYIVSSLCNLNDLSLVIPIQDGIE